MSSNLSGLLPEFCGAKPRQKRRPFVSAAGGMVTDQQTAVPISNTRNASLMAQSEFVDISVERQPAP